MIENVLKSLTLSGIKMAIPLTGLVLPIGYLTIFVKKINLNCIKIIQFIQVYPVLSIQ
jgi:hypothetical protein